MNLMQAKSDVRAEGVYAPFVSTRTSSADAADKTNTAQRWPISRMLWVAALVSTALWVALGLIAWQAYQLLT